MIENSITNQQLLKHMKVTFWSVFFTALGIVLYLADVFSDIYLAYKHYRNGKMSYFCMTLLLILFSAVVSSFFSFYMYIIDDKKPELKATRKTWIKRAIFLIFGFAPVWRSIDALSFAWESYCSKDKTEKHKHARRMVFEVNDGAFLRLFEAFLESGPQLVLQLYIFVQTHYLNENYEEIGMWDCFSLLTSAVSLSCSIVSYLNSLRNSLDHKNELKLCLLGLLFLCRFLELSSRVIAISLGISATLYLLFVLVIHFIVVGAWIYSLKTDLFNHWYAEKIYNVLLALILVFVYFNPEDSPTKMRSTQFYVAVFLENTVMMVFWFCWCCPDLTFKFSAMLFQILIFSFSILLMVIYYRYFHPTVGVLTKKKTRETTTSTLKNVAGNVAEKEENSAMLKNCVSDDVKEEIVCLKDLKKREEKSLILKNNVSGDVKEKKVCFGDDIMEKEEESIMLKNVFGDVNEKEVCFGDDIMGKEEESIMLKNVSGDVNEKEVYFGDDIMGKEEESMKNVSGDVNEKEVCFEDDIMEKEEESIMLKNVSGDVNEKEKIRFY